jgi:hypothetical protein
MSGDFTISLARLHELPAVMASYKAHRAVVNARQKQILGVFVDNAVEQILDYIKTIEIPLDAGKATCLVLEYSIGETDLDSLAIVRDISQEGCREGTKISCHLDDKMIGNLKRQDFLDQDSLTRHTYNQLVPRLKQEIRSEFPEGNVKVSAKRERVDISAVDFNPETNEQTETAVTTPRHLVITVSLPSVESQTRLTKSTAHKAPRRRPGRAKQVRSGRNH